MMESSNPPAYEKNANNKTDESPTVHASESVVRPQHSDIPESEALDADAISPTLPLNASVPITISPDNKGVHDIKGESDITGGANDASPLAGGSAPIKKDVPAQNRKMSEREAMALQARSPMRSVLHAARRTSLRYTETPRE